MWANPEVVRKFLINGTKCCLIWTLLTPNKFGTVMTVDARMSMMKDEVLGETGVSEYCTILKEQGEMSTIITFANATGLAIPPLIIHNEGKVSDTWHINCLGGVKVWASPKGWIYQDIFFEYTVRWISFMKTHGLLGKHHLFLLDAHKSHIYNIRFIKICK